MTMNMLPFCTHETSPEPDIREHQFVAAAFSRAGQVVGVSKPSVTMYDKVLRARLHEELLLQVRTGLPITYAQLAMRGALPSAGATGAIRHALEWMMDDDADKDRPILAAVAVRTMATGIPAPWFFQKAETLGLFAGDLGSVEAYEFHAREFHRVVRFHSRPSHERRDAGSVVSSDGTRG